jgi:hypothetical protein
MIRDWWVRNRGDLIFGLVGGLVGGVIFVAVLAWANGSGR